MKAQLVFAAILVASAIAQGTYFNGQTNNLALPTNSGFSSFSSSSSSSSSGSFSGSGSSFGSSIQTPTFPTANLNSLIGGSTSSAVTAQNVASILASTKAEQSTPVTSMDTLFVKFPSKIQLGRLVDSGDGAAMIKTIQVVASDDSVPCGTKISYLLEFMGMVKYAISRKSLAIDQLITIIDGAKNQINRLQNQISRLERDRASLNIPILQSQIADLISRLESLYNQINAWKVQVDPEKARIVGFQSELKTIQKQSDDERNRISNDKLKLATTVNSIKDLEGKLRDLRDTQNALETSITRSEGIIRDNDARLANIRNTIADIQSKIKGIQANIDGLRRQSNALQVDLERARSDLSVNKVKDNNLVNEIRALKQRINVEQTKLVDTDLRNLRAIVDNLNRAIPQIQAAIDRQYYYCYGAGKIQVETTGNTVVYVVRGDVFTQYANSAYGLNLGGANVRFNDFRFTVVDPFSPVWTSKFGSVPDSGAFGSYSCMSNGGAGSSGRGTITGISSGTITVSDGSGQTIELGLAPCSRLESTTQVPKSGQNILWKGRNSGSKNKYTLETGTCY